MPLVRSTGTTVLGPLAIATSAIAVGGWSGSVR